MRCPDCSKMVSYDEPQVEVQSEDIDDGGNISIEVRVVLPCMECGLELKETILTLEDMIEHECKKQNLIEPPEDREDGFTLELEDPEPMEDYRPKTDKKGKPVPMRYQKHFFGASINGKAICGQCGEEIEFTIYGDEQASSFEELV